jgi:hypothetical protein
MKGQAAVMDGLIFMLIASGAATLLLFVSGLYASSTNGQIASIYNSEYLGNALIALHYAKDTDGKWFWNELRTKLETKDKATIEAYFNSAANQIWENITYSSPAGDRTFLCFDGLGLTDNCYPFGKVGLLSSTTVYTYSVKITPEIDVILKLYY